MPPLNAGHLPLVGWGVTSLFVAAGYLLGCAVPGYYLVRWRKGKDIRNEGSGSAGATNVSRVLGKAGFVTTFLLDLAKGALIAGLAVYLELGPWTRLFGGFAVVAGQIWPIQLRLRGGKGVATLLGVLLIFDPPIVGIMFIICLVMLSILRRFTLSGIIAMASAPIAVAVFLPPPSRAWNLLLLVLPVLYAHRQNLQEDVKWIGALYPRRTSTGRQDPGEK